MPVTHVVSFKYKDSTSTEERTDLYNHFNTFKTACLDTDGKPYILDFKSSTQNTSVENAGKGFHHIFISTFPSQDHVKYYLEEDPVHLAFVVSNRLLFRRTAQDVMLTLTLSSLVHSPIRTGKGQAGARRCLHLRFRQLIRSSICIALNHCNVARTRSGL